MDDSDDSDYADQVDWDNDIDKDYDDLFLEWVNEEPQDIKAKKTKEHHIDSDYDYDDLQLPTLESEEEESDHEVVWRKEKRRKIRM